MRFAIDTEGRSPLHRQLADQIRYAISVGDLVPGDRLASIRELEEELQINRNTIRRTYLDLEAEGLLVLRQGREAQVAPRPRSRSRMDAAELTEVAEGLSRLLLQRAESEGLDALHLAEHFMRVARDHDVAHPKWVFLECSARQAGYLAGRVEQSLARRVIGLDLHDLRDDPRTLPASVRFALTPPWHAGEARELLRSHSVELFIVGVRLSADCAQALQAFQGRAIGLVVRDAQSAPGFSDIVQRHVGAAAVRVVLSDDAQGLAGLLREVDALVYTPPCAEPVRSAAPAGMPIHELVFDPISEDLRAVRDDVFPALSAAMPAPEKRIDEFRPASAKC